MPPLLPCDSTPIRPKDIGSQALAAALSAASARGLDSALLTSWGGQHASSVTTPVPPLKGFDAAVAGRQGPISRRTLLTDSGSSHANVFDLTKAAASPLQHNTSTSRSLPVADIDALAQLIGHTTHLARTGSNHTLQRSKKHRGRGAAGGATDRCTAKSSGLLPQFTKGFSLYMKRWDASYYFGQPATSRTPDHAPAANIFAAKQVPESPRLKSAIATVGHQSIWHAAAAAAKEKIAAIEADHEKQRRRGSVTAAKLNQVEGFAGLGQCT